MIRPTPLMMTLTLLTLATGCGPHKPTAAEIQAKSDQVAGSGRSQFYQELAQRNVTWYVAGSPSSAGLNPDTGLPERSISSLPPDMQQPQFVKAHNDAVLEYIQNNGAVPGSFLPWENDLFHQPAYWAAHSANQPDILGPGSTVTSPGGQYTVTLHDSQILVKSDSGEARAAAPTGASGNSADVLFGPSGSDLLYTRWPAGEGQALYAAMNLRDGRWISVQTGGR